MRHYSLEWMVKFFCLLFFTGLVHLRGWSQPPNIVLIMADDLGYGGIGCYGNQDIETPNLDQLASEGLLFTDFHSNGSVCTPTRAALMTGRYQQRSGLEGVIYVRGETRKVGLDTSELTIAEILKEVGYNTGIMGKWHLGYETQYNPVYHGFDEFYGYVSGNIDYHTHYDNAGIYDWWHNLDTLVEDGYVTDLITRHAIDFIDANRNHPFFLYISQEAPHVPFQGRADPGYRFPDREFTYYGPVEDRQRAYREMVIVMDEGIGEVLRTLEKHNLRRNTLVIFISDNGAESFGHNGSLRGVKGQLLEGGHRVPAIFSMPGMIEPGISNALAMTMDIFPTLLSVAGMDQPGKMKWDGIDFTPVLFEESDLPERSIFWKYRGQFAVRKGEWKLLRDQQGEYLYNLDSDLQEKTNLAATHTREFEHLEEVLRQWVDEMNKIPLKTR